MNQLAHRSFSSTFVWVGAVRDVAIEIFRYRDFRGQSAPVFRDLDIFLFENDLATVVGDFRIAAFPLNLIEWRYGGGAKYTFKTQPAFFFPFHHVFSPFV